MESGNIAACLSGYSRHNREEISGTRVRVPETGKYAVLHSVDELDILHAGSVDVVPELMRKRVHIG